MRTQLYIDGQWVDGNGTLDVIDPSDGSVIAKVATAGDAEIGLRSPPPIALHLPGQRSRPEFALKCYVKHLS